MRRFSLPVLLTLLLTTATVARGEDDPSDPPAGEEAPLTSLEKEIVITASRIRTELQNTGADVAIVTARENELRQARFAAEAIRPVPGVFVGRGGPAGGATSVFVRGAGSNQTVVMVDGVQVNDPTLGGQFNFFDLGLDNTGRIEVLRGSASSTWGSDAIGGVINVMGRRGEGDPGFAVGLEGGSFGYLRAAVAAQGKVDGFDFSAEISETRWHNDVSNNEFEGNTVSGRFGFDLGDDLALLLSVRYVNAEAEDPWAFPFGRSDRRGREHRP